MADGRHDLDYDLTGQLAWCKTCTAAEGELPTDCPGRQLSPDEKEHIYAGRQDFVDGRWTSPLLALAEAL